MRSSEEIRAQIYYLGRTLPAYQPDKGESFNNDITIQRQGILSRIAALRWVLGDKPELGEIHVPF